jgi:hypothetical protein
MGLISFAPCVSPFVERLARLAATVTKVRRRTRKGQSAGLAGRMEPLERSDGLAIAQCHLRSPHSPDPTIERYVPRCHSARGLFPADGSKVHHLPCATIWRWTPRFSASCVIPDLIHGGMRAGYGSFHRAVPNQNGGGCATVWTAVPQGRDERSASHWHVRWPFRLYVGVAESLLGCYWSIWCR